MDRLKIQHLKDWQSINDENCISLYMPSHRTGRDTTQDRIRFKNLLNQAENHLRERGLRDKQIKDLLNPLHELQQETPVWANMSDGFVVFRSENHFSFNQFPVSFDERVTVKNRFYLKPLLPLITGNGLYYVLGLSQKEIHLYEGSRFNLTRIDPDFLPGDLAETLRIEEFITSSQFHTSAPMQNAGQRAAIFHGHGAGEEDDKTLIKQYFREIDKKLTPFFDDRQVPLVLAGVGYLLPIYHEINTHPGLMKDGVKGNPDQLGKEEIHKKSWEIVSDHFNNDFNKTVEEYNQNKSADLAEFAIEPVLKAVNSGRVHSLMVSLDDEIRGVFDQSTLSVSKNGNHSDEDLLDLAAVKALEKGSKVYALGKNQMPDGKDVIALMRY